MIWEVIWPIVLTLFFIGLTILTILLIPVVIQLRDTLTKFNSTLDTINHDLPQIMDNVNEVTKTVNTASIKIQGAVDSFAELETIITQQIKVPLRTIAQIISSLLKLVTLFAGRRKNRI
jgi:uncharacterized protein YoxC